MTTHNEELEELRRQLKATIGKRLKDTRNEMHKSQQDLLDELKRYGLERTQGSISQIENGKRLPSLETLYVISKFFDTSTDYLYGLTGNQLAATDIDEELAAARGEGRINKLMRGMSRQKQQQVLTFTEYLLSREENSPNYTVKVSPLPQTERQRNLTMIRTRLDSVEREYGIEARRDMERSIRDEFSGGDSVK